MKSVKTILICVCLLLSANIYSQAKEWRGIVPLHSTREDVERLLGPPVQPCRFESCFYETAEEHVFVAYSRGPCPEDEFKPFNVPRGTVEEIAVTPKKNLPLSDLHLDPSKYEKTEDSEVSGVIYYDNAEEGVLFEVDSGLVTEIRYWPGAKYEYLRCPPAKEGVFTKLGQPCPTVRIEGPTGVIQLDKTIILNAVAVGLKRRILPTYNWTVSAGQIVSGQGTSALTIDPRGLSPQTITITVQVVPFAEECRNVVAYTLKLGDTPRKDKPESKGSRRQRLARQRLAQRQPCR